MVNLCKIVSCYNTLMPKTFHKVFTIDASRNPRKMNLENFGPFVLVTLIATSRTDLGPQKVAESKVYRDPLLNM